MKTEYTSLIDTALNAHPIFQIAAVIAGTLFAAQIAITILFPSKF